LAARVYDMQPPLPRRPYQLTLKIVDQLISFVNDTTHLDGKECAELSSQSLVAGGVTERPPLYRKEGAA